MVLADKGADDTKHTRYLVHLTNWEMVVVESHSQNEGKDRSDEHRVIGETERRDQQTAADLHHSRKESSKQTTEQLLWKQRKIRNHRRRHHEKGNNAQAEEDGLVSDDSGTETETLALLPVIDENSKKDEH